MTGVTAEDRALKYLIEEDTTFDATQLLSLNSKMTNEVQFRIRQRYALLTLWFQQTSTSPWTDTSGWLVNVDECDNWYGVECSSIDLGGNVGIQNVVTKIQLFQNNLQGAIPADLGLLTALTNVLVAGNSLTGTLPSSIGQWTALTSFNMGDNALTGTLPSSIGQWIALDLFAVYNNMLTGTIPTSIGSWSQIQIAYFRSNQFTGTMPNSVCSFIDVAIDELSADCLNEINCPCCTSCF
jgi:hypothetical protein